MSIMIPSCNGHADMKFSKKNVAQYAKNAIVKNIITIDKYNVGMKSLDRAIIVSDTLKTETSPIFIFQVPVPFPFPDSGFRLFHTPGGGGESGQQSATTLVLQTSGKPAFSTEKLFYFMQFQNKIKRECFSLISFWGYLPKRSQRR